MRHRDEKGQSNAGLDYQAKQKSRSREELLVSPMRAPNTCSQKQTGLDRVSIERARPTSHLALVSPTRHREYAVHFQQRRARCVRVPLLNRSAPSAGLGGFDPRRFFGRCTGHLSSSTFVKEHAGCRFVGR